MIQGKVWGETSPLLVTPHIEIHKAKINPGGQCSKHKHNFKWNAFYCLEGYIEIHVKKNDYDLVDVTSLEPGEFTTVPPGEIHWFHVPSFSSGNTKILEIYYPQGITDDIIRETVGFINNED
jgi:mannose-6-phosphate isomerase-like protein (cupin superfamily)